MGRGEKKRVGACACTVGCRKHIEVTYIWCKMDKNHCVIDEC